MIALIMAGGSGKRFWPLSNDNLPKQYLTLFDKKSMLKLAYERMLPFIKKDDIYIVTTHEQVPLVYDYLPEINSCQIIAEPCAMNTGPCIALSVANFLWNYSRDERVLVVPADHYIPDIEKFGEAIIEADKRAKEDFIIIFGIKPTYPATGFGYIETGNFVKDNVFHVKHFKEKPDKEMAVTFLNKGNYYWNSGMFCFSIFSIIKAFEKHNKEIFDKAVEVSCIKDLKEKREKYKTLPILPFDISVLEKADNVLTILGDFTWSDVGNWSSLSDLMVKDENNNYSKGKSQYINSHNNSVFSKKFTALIGVDDLIIVETANSILVCKKEDAELVKNLFQ